MITLYSKPDCPYCEKAKYYLKSHEIAFETVDITQDPAAREALISAGHRTVPQLYLDGKLLVEGGFTGLVAMPVEELTAKLALA